MDVLQLGARLELHELVDRRSCRERAVQDSFDLPCDRHGHPEALREGGDGRSAADTFGDRQHAGGDVAQRTAPPEFLTEVLITALRAATSCGQVAVAGESQERDRLGPHSDTQTRSRPSHG